VRGGGPRRGRGKAGNRGTHTLSHASSPRTTLNAPMGNTDHQEAEDVDVDDTYPVDDPDPDTPEDREKFYQEVRVDYIVDHRTAYFAPASESSGD
jgi:hypothetical protein